MSFVAQNSKKSCPQSFLILQCFQFTDSCFFRPVKNEIQYTFTALDSSQHSVTKLQAGLRIIFPKIQLPIESFRKVRILSYFRFRKFQDSFLYEKQLNLGSEMEKIKVTIWPFIHFTHGFRSLHRSELTYFWKLCQARRQQLTFFNQA